MEQSAKALLRNSAKDELARGLPASVGLARQGFQDAVSQEWK